jgi:alanyl-tRNA synthetase
MTINEEEFAAAREEAIKESQSGKSAAVAGIDLNVHDLDTLKAAGVPPTDDSPKYDYSLVGENKYAFKDIETTVLALRTRDGFVDSVESGEGEEGVDVGIVVDCTNFYAEQGGQIYDTGLFRDESGDVDFTVLDVQKRGPYCLHIGNLANGSISKGDKLTLSFDEERRRFNMSNHTATHVLNYALRKVLGEADQKGSLVEPERLRFDFTSKKGLNIKQITEVEAIVQDVIAQKLAVDALDAPLAEARAINGLRAMFGETYPDPVRVVSVGPAVSDVLSDPGSDAAVDSSIEFCGGTHVKNSGDLEEFFILTEEAISRGIRRIVAVTGHEARKALELAEALEPEIHDGLTFKQVGTLDNEISKSVIPAVLKDKLRAKLKVIGKRHAEIAKERRKQMAANAEKRANELLEEEPRPFYVEVLDVGANGKAIAQAINLLEPGRPEAPMLFFGVEDGAVAYNCLVPKSLVAKGFSAADWVNEVGAVLGGRGGGKPDKAQGSAADDSKVEAALKAAVDYATAKLA